METTTNANLVRRQKNILWQSHNKLLNVRKPHARNPNFETEETKILILLWGDPKVQKTLLTTHKKSPLIMQLTNRMREHGFNRSPEEINTRIKNLKCFYNRTKKQLDAGIITETAWKHYEAMHEILSRPIFGNNNRVQLMQDQQHQELITNTDLNTKDGGSRSLSSYSSGSNSEYKCNNGKEISHKTRGSNGIRTAKQRKIDDDFDYGSGGDDGGGGGGDDDDGHVNIDDDDGDDDDTDCTEDGVDMEDEEDDTDDNDRELRPEDLLSVEEENDHDNDFEKIIPKTEPLDIEYDGLLENTELLYSECGVPLKTSFPELSAYLKLASKRPDSIKKLKEIGKSTSNIPARITSNGLTTNTVTTTVPSKSCTIISSDTSTNVKPSTIPETTTIISPFIRRKSKDEIQRTTTSSSSSSPAQFTSLDKLTKPPNSGTVGQSKISLVPTNMLLKGAPQTATITATTPSNLIIRQHQPINPLPSTMNVNQQQSFSFQPHHILCAKSVAGSKTTYTTTPGSAIPSMQLLLVNPLHSKSNQSIINSAPVTNTVTTQVSSTLAGTTFSLPPNFYDGLNSTTPSINGYNGNAINKQSFLSSSPIINISEHEQSAKHSNSKSGKIKNDRAETNDLLRELVKLHKNSLGVSKERLLLEKQRLNFERGIAQKLINYFIPSDKINGNQKEGKLN